MFMLKLNVPPAIMREAAFMVDDDRVQKLADTYEKLFDRKNCVPDHEKSKPDEHKPQRSRECKVIGIL